MHTRINVYTVGTNGKKGPWSGRPTYAASTGPLSPLDGGWQAH